jgi:RNA polymerase sigma factor (sigma-70 family)
LTHDGRSDEPYELLPLTFERKKGGTYSRRAEVESEIRAAANRPLLELVSGKPSASNSCLLYFVRNYRPNGPSTIQEALVTELLNRIERQVLGGTRGLSEGWRTKVRLDIRDWFLEKIFSRSDRLDVYEFAFGKALKARIIDTIRKLETRDKVEIGEGAFEEEDRDGQGTIDALNYRHTGPRTSSTEALIELKMVLSLLTEKERKVLIATEAHGLSQDEAGRLIDVGARRVRQLLDSARDKIEAFKKRGEEE